MCEIDSLINFSENPSVLILHTWEEAAVHPPLQLLSCQQTPPALCCIRNEAFLSASAQAVHRPGENGPQESFNIPRVWVCGSEMEPKEMPEWHSTGPPGPTASECEGGALGDWLLRAHRRRHPSHAPA